MKNSAAKKIAPMLLALTCLAGCGQMPDAPAAALTGSPYDYDLTEYVALREYREIPYVPYGTPNRTTAAYGDTVTVEIQAVVNGETVTGTDVFVLGHSGFLEGFDEALAGHRVDDTVTMSLRFPEDYGDPAYDGQEAQVTASILMLDLTADRQINEDALWRIVVDESPVQKYPEAELEQYTQDFRENYAAFARQYGMELGDYLRSFFQTEEAELDALCRRNAEELIHQEMVMYAVFRDAGLRLTQADLDQCKPQWLRTYGYEQESDLPVSWEDPGVAESLERMAVLAKVKAFLLQQAVPTDAP